MSYIVLSDLTSRFDIRDVAGLARDSGQRCQTDAEANTILTTDSAAQNAIAECIADAAIPIDLYMNGYADMTDSGNIAKAQRWQSDIAMYYLHERRKGGKVGNPYRQSYEDAMLMLQDVQKRKLLLGTNPEKPSPRVRSNTSGKCLYLDKDSMRNF